MRRPVAITGAMIVIISLIFGAMYGTAQQILRLGADDPQIRIAEDGARQLNQSALPQTVVGSTTVDVANQLSPFTIVYDKQGNILASSARLNGTTPKIPGGVLREADHGQNRVTWEPQDGVRLATVSTKFDNGYIVSGRSLREVEQRETAISYIALIGWTGSLLALLVAILANQPLGKKRKRS